MSFGNGGSADSFVEGLCMYRGPTLVLFVISMVLFALSLISFTVVESGTGTHVIVILNLVTLGVFLAATGAVLAVCRDKTHR